MRTMCYPAQVSREGMMRVRPNRCPVSCCRIRHGEVRPWSRPRLQLCPTESLLQPMADFC